MRANLVPLIDWAGGHRYPLLMREQPVSPVYYTDAGTGLAVFLVHGYPLDGRVWGEAHWMLDRDAVLGALDEIEGFRPNEPDSSLYTRAETIVTFDDGRTAPAWTYFYNAPLGQAQRIESGDYLEHLKVK